jgi:hypothetical protein
VLLVCLSCLLVALVFNGSRSSSDERRMSDSNQQEQMAGQMPMNMAAFGYGGQEAFMNMMRQGQGGGYPQQQQFDANGQPMQGGEGAPGDGQNPPNAMGMMQSPYGMPGMYPGMGFDPMQMQGMAAFGGFPGMPGFGVMDPSMQAMNPMFFQGGMQQGDVMSQANAALGQAQANTMNSSAVLAGAMNAQGMNAMGANGMMNMNMNPMAAMMGGGGDPNMLFRQMQMMQQQGGGNFFGAQGPAAAGQQANMFGFGSGAGVTAASYLSMAQQAGVGTGAASAGMMGSMVGGVGGPILNPYEPGKKGKNRKPKNKPKRPLSAYNVSKAIQQVVQVHWGLMLLLVCCFDADLRYSFSSSLRMREAGFFQGFPMTERKARRRSRKRMTKTTTKMVMKRRMTKRKRTTTKRTRRRMKTLK